MLPLGILLDRFRGGAFSAILLASVAMFAVFLFLNYFLQEIKLYSPLGSGLAFLPMVVMIALSATFSQNVLLPRLGPRPLVPVGMVIGALGMATFTRLTPTGSYWAEVFPGLVIMGLAMGVVFATTMNTATARVRPQDAGAASATVNVFQQIGGSIGTALLSTVAIAASLAFVPAATDTPSEIPALAQIHGYTQAFWWAVGVFALGAVVTAVLLPSGKAPPASEIHEGAMH
jgi:predicted MFS family arabinose efflux permease